MDQKLSGVLKPIKDLPIRDFILLVKFLKKYNALKKNTLEQLD